VSLRPAYGGETRGAIDYIVASVRLVGLEIDHCSSRLLGIRPEA